MSEKVRYMKKLLSLLLVLCMLVCFAACASSEAGKTANSTDRETQPPVETTEENQPAPSYVPLYAEMVRDFDKLIAFRQSEQFNDSWYENLQNADFSDTFFQATGNLGELAYRWDCMVIELLGPENSASQKDFGFMLHDLNGDSVPELFWLRQDYSLVAIFTYKNGTAVLLDAYWPRYRGFISQEGKLYSWGSGGAEDNHCGVYSLNAAGVLEETYAFASESDRDNNTVNYFEFKKGTKTEISAQRFEELSALYPDQQSDFWMSLPIMVLP